MVVSQSIMVGRITTGIQTARPSAVSVHAARHTAAVTSVFRSSSFTTVGLKDKKKKAALQSFEELHV